MRRQFKKTDSSKLRTAISEKITALGKDDLDSKEKIDKQMQALINIIQQAIEASTPLVNISHRSKPGFDWECKEAQVKAHRLRKIFNQIGTKEAWKDYKIVRLEAEYIIKKANRKAYWKS